MQFHKQLIEDRNQHSEQIDDLSKYVNRLGEISRKLDIENTPSINYAVLRVQIRYFLLSIFEINSAISDAISADRYSVAEALSRVSIEMSANLLFVIDGDRHARAKGLIQSYMDSTKKKADGWKEFADRSGLPSAKKAAIELKATIERHEKIMHGLKNMPFEKWPKYSSDKFKLIGHEESYRTIFQSSSDSIHLLGEDIFNITLCCLIPIEDKESLFAGISAEKESFAIYLLVNAVLFQIEAITKVLLKIGDHELEAKEVESINAEIKAMYERHEIDAKKLRELSRKGSAPGLALSE